VWNLAEKAPSNLIAAIVRNRDDLVDVLRARKAQLGLSNSFIEHQLHMADGGADKVLGPTQAKGMSLPVMFDLIELFGGRLVFEADPELEAKMQERWERREEAKVHPPRRVSRSILKRAAPLIRKQFAASGAAARNAMLASEQRVKLARKAANAKWRIHRAAVKARAVAEAGA
jgi:hypothetical protein